MKPDAEPKPKPIRAARELEDSDEPSTSYERIMSIAASQPDGTEVTLSLQSRTSRREDHTWYVVSWRTRLKPGGPNRRFYRTKGQMWALPISTAKDLLERLEKAGGLDAKYDDRFRRPDFRVRVVSGVGTGTDGTLAKEITMPDEDWGISPTLVVLDDPNAHWRKVMMLDHGRGMATFRSITADADYKPRVVMRAGSPWFLDNSMQDINVQQARVFLETLRTHEPKRFL